MKKWGLLLLLLLLLPVGFSCVANSVEVRTSVDLQNTQVYLIFEGSYNIIEEGVLYYYSHNDSSMNIRVSNESVTFHSLNSSTNWTRIVSEELELLRLIGSINLTQEDNIVIASLGQGVYENGRFTSLRSDCSETFTVPVVDNSSAWFAVLLSFVPGLLITIYLVRSKWKVYLAFVMGGVGWFIALLLREPLLSMLPATELVVSIIIASLLAGVFEEITRYLVLKYSKLARDNPLILGLGWGVTEAFIIYVVTISIFILLNQPVTFTDALPGAVERLISIGLHVSLTMIVYQGLKDKRLLLLAVFLHFFTNIAATITGYILLWDAWVIEALILIITIITGYIAFSLNKGGLNRVKKSKRRIRKTK